MKKLILILGLIPVIGFSQESNVGNWFMYLGNKKLNSNWNIHNEVQYRNYNVVGDMEQLLLRTGIGFNLSPNNNNILLGYGFIRSENYVSTDQKVGNNEHRIFQQFITRQSFNRVSLQHRYRFEQRFLENDFKLRFRYFISVNVALSKPKIEKNTFYLSAYNEVFIQSKENLYDRNRVYAGLGYAINKDFRIELGYMNQLFNKGSRDQINIIGIINF
ncbi:MAG: DUF2490 domain-containing protein [Flavobacteriales bacterium]|nr:DUF2490 domain-containing protein [bacterium]MDG1174347.1 DUF2490 domain-containing protein [Flavobacteriales bacterium]